MSPQAAAAVHLEGGKPHRSKQAKLTHSFKDNLKVNFSGRRQQTFVGAAAALCRCHYQIIILWCRWWWCTMGSSPPFWAVVAKWWRSGGVGFRTCSLPVKWYEILMGDECVAVLVETSPWILLIHVPLRIWEDLRLIKCHRAQSLLMQPAPTLDTSCEELKCQNEIWSYSWCN